MLYGRRILTPSQIGVFGSYFNMIELIVRSISEKLYIYLIFINKFIYLLVPFLLLKLDNFIGVEKPGKKSIFGKISPSTPQRFYYFLIILFLGSLFY